MELDAMTSFGSFAGVITAINDFVTEDERAAGCRKLMSVSGRDGNTVNFVVTPATYFVGHATVRVGNQVTGYYDANAPMLLIYPPQHEAVVMARQSRTLNVKVDYFDAQLLSGDGTLKLNLSPSTLMLLENDQLFTGNPANRNLIVVYGPTTRSIPAQTTPLRIIVMCDLK